jgi:hypothetical protein
VSEGFKFQASVKDADGDMVNVRADSAEELGSYLSNFPVAEYAQFKANVRGGAALGAVTQPQQGQPEWSQPAPAQQAPPQQQSQGWGAAQQQSAPPQQQGGGNRFGGQQHPEGKQCQCGQVLEVKTTGSNKTVFRCPQWRWNNGNPTPNHDQEWA